MSAEEKCLLIEKVCNDKVERVSAISATVSKVAYLLYPQLWQSISILSFSWIQYGEVLNNVHTETDLRMIHQLEKHFNMLEPKHKQKKMDGWMFIPSGYPSKP